MAGPLLDIRGVETYYGNIRALNGVNVSVNQGEIVTIIGANGAGKSTLMMTIFGSPRARAGSIVFNGTDITNMPTHEIARLRIAQSPEGRRIFPRMTVLENLQMGASLDNLNISTRTWKRSLRSSRVSGTHPAARRHAFRWRAADVVDRARADGAAEAVVARRTVARLSPLIVKQIFDAIRALNKEQGLTVFLVEQNAFGALKLATRGYVLVNGNVTMSGTGQELLANPEVRAAYLEGGRH
jgi:branched-chain amino acid transport system ATP-binding protein